MTLMRYAWCESLTQLPCGTEELNAWLLDRWVEKDQYLENLKRDWVEGITLK
jgi:hypothetical protein